MAIEYVIGLLLAIALLGCLGYALLRPERRGVSSATRRDAYDHSTARAFGGRREDPAARKNDQLVVLLGALAAF